MFRSLDAFVFFFKINTKKERSDADINDYQPRSVSGLNHRGDSPLRTPNRDGSKPRRNPYQFQPPDNNCQNFSAS